MLPMEEETHPGRQSPREGAGAAEARSDSQHSREAPAADDWPALRRAESGPEHASDSAASERFGAADHADAASASGSEASTVDTATEELSDGEPGVRPSPRGRRARAARDKASSAAAAPEVRQRDAVRRSAERALWQLSEDVEGPVLLLDLGRVSKTLRRWKRQLPRIKPHFIVRPGVNKDLLQLLHRAGCGFSCATAMDLRCALELGAMPQSVLFSHPSSPRVHLRYARSEGVRRVSFDSAAQLQKIAADFPGAQLLLHVACDEGPETRRPGLAPRFGAGTSEWPVLLGRARELGLRVTGIAVHHGEQSFGLPAISPDSSGFGEAFGCARGVLELASSLGFGIEVLNMGCILPPLGPGDVHDPALARVAAQLEQHFPSAEFPELQVIAEPGRLLLGRGGASLLTRAAAGEGAAPANWSLGHDGQAQRGPAVDALVASAAGRLGTAPSEPEVLQPPRRLPVNRGAEEGQDSGQPWLLWRTSDAYVAAAGLGGGEPLQALHHNTAARRSAPAMVHA